MPKINIAVVFGGKSEEHEVSLKSATEVMKALDKDKYDVIPIAITKGGNWLVGRKGGEYQSLNLPSAGKAGGVSLEQSQGLVEKKEEMDFSNFSEGDAMPKLDLVLPIGHGSYLEDGKIQGMFEMLGIPYAFSGTFASALAMNKQKTKLVARNAGLKIAKEMILRKGKKYKTEKIIQKLNLPIVVKPTDSGSSVGINIAKDQNELVSSIEKAFEFGEEIMLEQFIKGRELTVAVLGNKTLKALPVIEIIPKVSSFFSYEAKYQDGGSDEICPADIPDEIRKKIQKYAIKIFKALDCRDLARADFIWSADDNKLYFLEINTIPGMTSASLAPKAAKASGLSFSEFLDEIIKSAIKRQK
jgi:D-alanine-D-alanine ligase